jgi:hypothetical protein
MNAAAGEFPQALDGFSKSRLSVSRDAGKPQDFPGADLQTDV